MFSMNFGSHQTTNREMQALHFFQQNPRKPGNRKEADEEDDLNNAIQWWWRQQRLGL